MATGIHYDAPVFPEIERERSYCMLAFLRHRKRSWIIVFFVTMIVLVFVLWGVGRYINEPGPESLAKVNGESISPTDFAFHYQRLVDQYKNLLKGSLTEETLKNLNLRGLVIQELVRRQLLLQEARRLGLETSDEELRNEIGMMPEFQADGRFDQNRYLQILRANRLAPAQFENERRAELTLRKLYGLIGDSVMVTENEVKDRYRFEQEKVNLSYVRLSAEPFLPQVQITEEEIQAYYQQNRETMKEPLKVQVEYIAYPLDHFASKIPVSDREVEEFYKTHLKTKFHQPKAARLRHIFFRAPQEADAQQKEKSRLKAAAVLREAQQGKDFAQLAKTFSEDPSASNGGDLGFLPEGQMLAPLDRAAFALRKGQISGLIETPMGYHILKAEETREPKTQSLAETRSEIMNEIRKEKGKTETGNAAAADRGKALSGTPLSQLAKERGLASAQSGLFSQFEVVPEIGPVEEFNRGAFSLSMNETSPVIEGRQAYYILRLQKRKEPSVLPLTEVRSQIEKGLREKKASGLMLQKAKALLSQLKTEKDIQGIAKKNGLGIEETGWFPRNATQISKIGPLQEMAPGGIAVSMHQPIPDRIYQGQGAVYLFALKESQPADMERFQQEKKALQERMLAKKQQQILQKFVESLRAKAQIEVGAQLLEKEAG